MLINVRVGLGFARNGGGHREDSSGSLENHPSTLIFTQVSTIVQGGLSDERSTVSSVTATEIHA